MSAGVTDAWTIAEVASRAREILCRNGVELPDLKPLAFKEFVENVNNSSMRGGKKQRVHLSGNR